MNVKCREMIEEALGVEGNNLIIVYANVNDKKVVKQETEDILREILIKANINRKIIVTSTYRDPAEQVKAMIVNIKSLGVKSQKDLYSAKGDLLIDYYVSLKDKYKESIIVNMMVNKKIEIGFISAHEDWISKKGAFDLGRNSNGFSGTYSKEINPIINTAKEHPNVNSNQVFPPRNGENALHIEVKLK